MRFQLLAILVCLVTSSVVADDLRVFPEGQLPDDRRLGEPKNLNGYFPFRTVDGMEAWEARQGEIRRRILVSQGLWPMPTRAPLNPVIHGRVEREDYVVDRVFFESIPGHYVTGSLYRPKGKQGPFPAILSPHGHWSNGRFYDAGEGHVRDDIKIGAETFEVGGRYPIQARAVQLARMGCIVFIYDMTGNADSIQLGHRPAKWNHLDRKQDWGFMSVQAELRLQNMMGLQTWNSIRVIDFLVGLEDVDETRVGVTGASGGGTQSMIIGAIDDRIAAAMPCVMVSTAMQGGCTCENAPLLRIDQGNIDIAAAVAPRPLGLTAADDWTRELETKGYPDLVRLYEMLGHRDRLTAVFETRFKHNYNQVNRAVMYHFFNRHFGLGLTEPIVERDFRPLSRDEATVWSGDHVAPSGDQVGDRHEVRILRMAARDSEARVTSTVPGPSEESERFDQVVGGGWNTIFGRRLKDVGNVNFRETGRVRDRKTQQAYGYVDHVDAGEQLPIARLRSLEKPTRGIVLWITDGGKSELTGDGKWRGEVDQLLKDGFEVIAADLIGQGEFAIEENGIQSQPMWYQGKGESGWQRFSGYTYGYNHPMFVQRVHDVLTLVRFAQSQSEEIKLVGLGEIAGPVALAAASRCDGALNESFVDVNGFRFEDLTRHDDPMFVPGAVKYLDIDGLLAVAAPSSISIVGAARGNEIPVSVYRAAGASENLKFVDSVESLTKSIAD